MKKKYLNYVIIASSVLILVLIDQLVKVWMVKNLTIGDSLSVWKEYIQLTLTFNKGIAFGKFQVENTIVLGLVSLIVSGGIIFLVIKFADFKKRPLFTVALTLMLGGALGNMIDRIFKFPASLIGEEGVVDFVNTDFIPSIEWGIWNIADALLCIGTAVMIVHILFFYKEDDFKRLKKKNDHETLEEIDGTEVTIIDDVIPNDENIKDDSYDKT